MVVHGPYPVGEPRVAREAAVARDRGFEVDVLAMRRSGEPAEETVDGVRVSRLPLSHRRDAGFAGMVVEYVAFTSAAILVAAVRQLRRRYEVVHVHNPPDFLVAAALLPRLLGARVIFDVHDLSTHMFATRFPAGRAARAAERALLAVQRLAARAADAVVTVHEPYRRELAAQGLDPQRITVVMNSLDERLLDGLPRAARSDRSRVVYHGTVTAWYGLELLVEAAARLGDELDFDVEVYGEGDAVPALRAAAAERSLADRFRVTGTHVGHAEALAAVAGATAGVVPNLPSDLNRFALSSKLFEYVALGIPVVCADLPTLRAHFADDEIRFFRAGDAGSLAEALAEILRDPAAAAQRAERARRRYEEYRWTVQGARYAVLLDELAGR